MHRLAHGLAYLHRCESGKPPQSVLVQLQHPPQTYFRAHHLIFLARTQHELDFQHLHIHLNATTTAYYCSPSHKVFQYQR